MTIYHEEAKPQGWRAVALFDDRPECLLYVGRSSPQVRANFGESFWDLLDEDERGHVRSIALQRWQGAADAGRWVHQTSLTIPAKAKAVKVA